MTQRALISMALSVEPDLLIADEPSKFVNKPSWNDDVAAAAASAGAGGAGGAGGGRRRPVESGPGGGGPVRAAAGAAAAVRVRGRGHELRPRAHDGARRGPRAAAARGGGARRGRGGGAAGAPGLRLQRGRGRRVPGRGVRARRAVARLRRRGLCRRVAAARLRRARRRQRRPLRPLRRWRPGRVLALRLVPRGHQLRRARLCPPGGPPRVPVRVPLTPRPAHAWPCPRTRRKRRARAWCRTLPSPSGPPRSTPAFSVRRRRPRAARSILTAAGMLAGRQPPIQTGSAAGRPAATWQP